MKKTRKSSHWYSHTRINTVLAQWKIGLKLVSFIENTWDHTSKGGKLSGNWPLKTKSPSGFTASCHKLYDSLTNANRKARQDNNVVVTDHSKVHANPFNKKTKHYPNAFCRKLWACCTNVSNECSGYLSLNTNALATYHWTLQRPCTSTLQDKNSLRHTLSINKD